MQTVLVAINHENTKFYFHVIDDNDNEIFRSVTKLCDKKSNPVILSRESIRKIKENIKICSKKLELLNNVESFSNGIRFSSGEQKLVRGNKIQINQAKELILFFKSLYLEAETCK